VAVVVADVGVEEEYQFERRWYGSNPEQLQLLAKWLIDQRRSGTARLLRQLFGG